MRSPDNSYIIPFFIPHAGCPHQCSFCNQRTISGQGFRTAVSDDDIESAVRLYLSYSKKTHDSVQLAFFGGNFLGIGASTVIRYLDQAVRLYERGDIHGIRFSTRPDTVNAETMRLIKGYPVKTIEIGTQSMDPEVLGLSNRGHTPEDTAAAASLCRKEGVEVGIQIMIGLPGEDEESSRNTGKAVAGLEPDFVRIYPTVVVNGSPLADSYIKGRYKPLDLSDAVNRAGWLYSLFRKKNIRVARMGLQATSDLVPGATVLAGPYHPAFGHLVLSHLFLKKIRQLLFFWQKDMNLTGNHLVISCNYRSISRVRGDSNSNIRILMDEFGFRDVNVKADNDLNQDEAALELMAKDEAYLKHVYKGGYSVLRRDLLRA